MTRRRRRVEDLLGPGEILFFKKEDYFLYSRPSTPEADSSVVSPAGRGGLVLEVAPSEVDDGEFFYKVLSFDGAIGWIETWTAEEG